MPTALDLLRSQNDRLKSQLAALQAAANDAAAAGELAAKLKAANTRIQFAANHRHGGDAGKGGARKQGQAVVRRDGGIARRQCARGASAT